MRSLLIVLLVLTASCFGIFSEAFADEQASSSDQFDFRFMPVGLLFGALEADLDVKVAPEWTVGPIIGYSHNKYSSDSGFTTNYEYTRYAIGLRANWFSNGVYKDGFYVAPSLAMTKTKVTTSDSGGPVSNDASSDSATVVAGYGWFWSSFNMLVGGGGSLALGNTDMTLTHSDGSTTTISSRLGGLALEFSLGWTF